MNVLDKGIIKRAVYPRVYCTAMETDTVFAAGKSMAHAITIFSAVVVAARPAETKKMKIDVVSTPLRIVHLDFPGLLSFCWFNVHVDQRFPRHGRSPRSITLNTPVSEKRAREGLAWKSKPDGSRIFCVCYY